MVLVKVTTVYDLILLTTVLTVVSVVKMAKAYTDDTPYTPTWQRKITGVKRTLLLATVIVNLQIMQKTKGRSMIIMGGGINHWYHADVIYRTILNLIMFCGTGALTVVVGPLRRSRKLRPVEGWGGIMTANDWSKALVRQNGTSWFYFATEQYRSDCIDLADRVS